jgi:hypothetical protein
MGKEKQLKHRKPQTTGPASANAPLAEWFTQHISRRSVGKGLAWTAALGMAGVTIAQFAGGDEPEVSLDSLDLQKREGWDVGSKDRKLFYNEGLTANDSREKSWSAFDPNYLISIYQPRGARWQPFFVPTLIQSLSQQSLNSQVRLQNTAAMRESYERAEGLRNLIAQSPSASQTLIIADLPGPAAVAVGAAMADTAELVPVFDNWPHPLGVVRSHETLGSMIYYAHEVEEKRSKLGENAPAIMLLDSTRLSNYTDQDTQFDNRYLAKVPPAEQLKQRGIQNIVYLVKDQTQTQELDDINEDFVEWQKQGITVRMLRLSDFKPYEDTAAAPLSGGTTGNTTTVVRHHYYGGSPLLHWWFFSHYGYGSPGVLRDSRNIPIPRPSSPPPNYNPPTYRPTSRPTVFSSTRVGGATGTGVGRSRPTGFGRTSVRMGGDGNVTGVRSGRSGSYGRSGGGWFGG